MAESPTDSSEQRWPLEEQLKKLESYDLPTVEGRARLGALAFEDAPTQIREIIEILHELRQEPLDRLDPNFIAEITGQLNGLIDVIDQMVALTAADPTAADQKANYESQLAGYYTYFRTSVRPRAITARIREEMQAQSPTELATRVRDQIEEADERLQRLQHREAELAQQLEALESVANVQREAASVSAADELSTDYSRQADDHAKAWKLWGKWLIAAVVFAIGGGIAVLLAAHPEKNATNAQIVSRLTLILLVIGLLLYVVRLTSLQFRVHRHLEAVARSKAAALSTFNRIVVGPAESEVRTAVAQVLAQAVFKTDDTGFIDASAEHITLIERVVGPAIQRVSQ